MTRRRAAGATRMGKKEKSDEMHSPQAVEPKTVWIVRCEIVWIIRWAEELEGNPGRTELRDFLTASSQGAAKPQWSTRRDEAWEIDTPEEAVAACLAWWPEQQIDSSEGPAIIGQRALDIAKARRRG